VWIKAVDIHACIWIYGLAGLGLLGRGIAGCLLAHGIPVAAYDISPAERSASSIAITNAIDELIDHGYCDPSVETTWRKLYTEAKSVDELAQCDFLIESVVESAEAKAALFDQLEAILTPTTPIASNTSAMPITLLQKNRKHPARFLGMHWAEPAHATRFLEIIRGELTDDASIDAATKLAISLEKDPCIVQQDIPGFIANRLGYAMYREACNLLELGVADAETIDRSFCNSVGLWASVCGPLRWIDLTGGPALYGAAMAGVLPTLSNTAEVPEPLRSMMQTGATGVRGGQGFYTYTRSEAKAWQQIYRRKVWRVRETVDEAFPLDAEIG
jgi:3-hydroxybutyryl-CoA dehydrogenase